MQTVEWLQGRVRVIDQRKVPAELTYLELDTLPSVVDAVRGGVVTGASAVSVAGFGLGIAAQTSTASDTATLRAELVAAADALRAASSVPGLRPALERLLAEANKPELSSVDTIKNAVALTAQQLNERDIETYKLLGGHGSLVVKNGDKVLYHCQPGGLSALDYSSALGVIRTAYEDGKRLEVLLVDSHPRLHGAGAAGWELQQLGIQFQVVPGAAAGTLIQRGDIKACFIDAERVAANGDTISALGAYAVAVTAKENWLPVYVAAPVFVMDTDAPTAEDIPQPEGHYPYDMTVLPEGWGVQPPAFDRVPAACISGLVTEFGLVKPPFPDNLRKLLAQ